MGLDFSHTDAQWSYGGFGRFREALAKYEGIDLPKMRGFCPCFGIAADHHTHPALPWDDITTPLKPLLNHSDSDGDLSPEQCTQVAPRLREVVTALWANPDPADSLARHSLQQGLALADGLELAATQGERFEFQ